MAAENNFNRILLKLSGEGLMGNREFGLDADTVDRICNEISDVHRDGIEICLVIEAGNIFGWEKYVGPDGISLGIKSFGKSAPYKKIYEHFNLTSDNVVKTAKKMLGK